MTAALVTGASAGLGAEFCRQLAASGHDLVLVARDPERLEQLAHRLRTDHEVRVEVLPADLADRAALQRVADRVAGDGSGDPHAPGVSDGVGSIDLLVNNAGFGLRTAFSASALADEERALDVMCRAVLVLSHAAARSMGARGYGGIINVSSVAGYAAMGSYSAAKAWVTTFSESLAVELAPRGVCVTAVCPGFTRTQFHDRAEMDMSRLPDRLWLRAEDVVADALEAVRRGRPVSVPGWQYKVLTGVLRAAPRRLVAGGSTGLAGLRRRRGA